MLDWRSLAHGFGEAQRRIERDRSDQRERIDSLFARGCEKLSCPYLPLCTSKGQQREHRTIARATERRAKLACALGA